MSLKGGKKKKKNNKKILKNRKLSQAVADEAADGGI